MQRIIEALCGASADPASREQASIIAEAEIQLARVRAARIATIQRHRAPRENAVLELDAALLRLRRYDPQNAGSELLGLARQLAGAAKFANDCVVPAGKPTESGLPIGDPPAIAREGDDLSAVVAALPELLRLERYERRAWSRRRRAMEMLNAVQSASRYKQKEYTGVLSV